jgi:predicted DsbA family dithiol-disulfide isomerase
MVEFGTELSWTFVMGGLARDYASGHEDREAGIGGRVGVYPGLMAHWLTVADRSGMPFDPLIWTESPIGSTYPACMAVKAAVEQAPDGGYAYLRALREGLCCFRRKLDTTEALVEEARRTSLDVERFRIDLNSHAIVESFGSDLEEARAVPDEARAHEGGVERVDGRDRMALPSMIFTGEAGAAHGVFGPHPYEDYRAAAEAAGARAGDAERPGVVEALRRFGRMATREVEAVCGLPRPRASAELWRLAGDWQVTNVSVLTGDLWELA